MRPAFFRNRNREISITETTRLNLRPARRSPGGSAWVWYVALVLGMASHPSVALRAEELQYPISIGFDAKGTPHVVDRDLPGVLKWEDNTWKIVLQGEKKFRQPLNSPRCIAFDSAGGLFVGDSATREVYQLNAEGKPVPLAMQIVGIPAGIAFKKSGEMLVADQEENCIWQVPKDGKPQMFVEVKGPKCLTIDGSENIWVISQDSLLKIMPDGKSETVVKAEAVHVSDKKQQGPWRLPLGIAVDASGNVFVSDGYGQAIWKVEPGAAPKKLAGGAPLVHPVGLTIHENQLYVVDPRAKAVFQVSADGQFSPLGGASDK